ncbi:MAG: TolC family protein [Sphingobacterium sp.]|uniref:TolC family protein n=1 Tax=Sphingobacterium sp. JB170 TaxID=1434842 RepID=UPI00097EBBC6|nr:TolC family protein [Sphingobacterium sp. JB170]SJN47726.1 Heavy metal RND efflux outer membrane protein, CzcC family [Sphingobacterium sp. JB170]
MKYIYIFFVTIAFTLGGNACAQSLSLERLEQDFLSSNYLLIAAKYNIAEAQANVVQKKLWPNPSFSVGEVNLWANANSESLPPLLGKYGRHQQVSLELEQLLETAGKRSKRVTVAKLQQQMALTEFEALVRELKKELRQTYYHALILRRNQKQLDQVFKLFEQLTSQYAEQARLQNVSHADYQRVQAELINLKGERATLEADITLTLHTLRTLTQREDIIIEGLEDGKVFESPRARLPDGIENQALESNIRLLQRQIDVEIAEGELTLEKANAKPDVTLQLGYDRGGSIMQDFIGLGLSMDLPIFNRNKGNILSAKQNVSTNRANQASAKWELRSNLRKNQEQLSSYENILSGIPPTSTDELQATVEKYKNHLLRQQITLIEFVDFIQALRDANLTILTVWENYNNTFEELQYLVGNDF